MRLVESLYEKTTARVMVGEGDSEEFEVKIGLRQGIVLIPLLFIAVLDLTSRKTVEKDVMKTDLALVANGKQELQETPVGGVERAVYQTRAENLPREADVLQATRGKSWTSSWRGRN